MKKLKQLLAFLGVLLLVCLYAGTLICAIFDRSETMQLFRASVFATVVIPVLIWAFTLIYKLTHRK